MAHGIQEGDYQRLAIPFPVQGKNTTIAPQKLPTQFSSAMVNIVPGQSGLGEVRFGCVDVVAGQNLAADAVVLKHWPYTWQGALHRICYGYEFTIEPGSSFTWVAKNQVQLTTTVGSPTYYADMPLKLTYTASGGNQRTIYPIVTAVSGSGTITITFSGDELPASSVTVDSIAYAQGKVWKMNTTTGAYTALRSGLRAAVIPVGVQTDDGKLTIVNGYDDNMSYDGTSISTLFGWAKEQGISPTWLSANSVKVTTGTEIGASNYQPISGAARQVQVEYSTPSGGLNISSISFSAGLATYTTTVNSNLRIGALVTVTGSAIANYNITGRVVAATANTFQLAVTGSPANEAVSAAKWATNNLLMTTTVSGASLSNMDTTVTLAANVLPAASVTINFIYYEKRPPIFRYIAKAHDRLWALAGSVPRADQFQNGTDATRIYYTVTANSSVAWFGAADSLHKFVDVVGKQLKSDNVEAIVGINGGMAFVGRAETQIWVGTDPTVTDPEASNIFRWDKTIPIGCAHPMLITDLPNDAAILTSAGVRTLSSINDTQQFSVGDDVGAPVATEMAKELLELRTDRWKYLKAGAFTYARGRFIGYKMGRVTHIYLINFFGRSWGELVGDFASADWIGTDDFSNILLLSIGGKVQRYADGGGGNSTLAWGDRNNTETVSWYWFTPWIKASQTGRWANFRAELDIDPGAGVTMEMVALLDGDGRKEMKRSITTPSRVDAYYTATSKIFTYPVKRLRFVAKNFMLGVRGQTKAGPIKLNGINLYGRSER